MVADLIVEVGMTAAFLVEGVMDTTEATAVVIMIEVTLEVDMEAVIEDLRVMTVDQCHTVMTPEIGEDPAVMWMYGTETTMDTEVETDRLHVLTDAVPQWVEWGALHLTTMNLLLPAEVDHRLLEAGVAAAVLLVDTRSPQSG